MHISRLSSCEEFTAGDGSVLRELLHAEKGEFPFRYSLAHAVVKPGIATLPHKLSASEVYYIMSGTGKMHIDDEVSCVGPGDAISIPPGGRQFIENTGECDLVFLCIVDPAWRKAYEDVEQGGV